MSLLKVDPLPAYKYFSVHPSLSVEAALGMAASVNHSLADLLNLYLLQPDGEFTNLAALELAARCAAELIDASVSALQKDREEGGGSMKTSIKVDPCTPMGSFRICPNTSVDEALREAERLINSIQFLFSDLDGDPLEPGVHFGIEFLARCAAELVDSARRGVVRHEGGASE